jgi:hypothetical protein
MKCIQNMVAHWGCMFTEGKDYTIKEIVETETGIYSDSVKYFELISIGLKRSHEIGHHQNQTPEQIDQHKENNIVFKEAYEKYKTQINLKFAIIEDNFGSTHRFCLTNLEKIKKKYNFTEEIGFECTINIIDEYFDYTPIRREKKLKRLINA